MSFYCLSRALRQRTCHCSIVGLLIFSLASLFTFSVYVINDSRRPAPINAFLNNKPRPAQSAIRCNPAGGRSISSNAKRPIESHRASKTSSSANSGGLFTFPKIEGSKSFVSTMYGIHLDGECPRSEQLVREVKASVKTSIIAELSPMVKRHVEKMFANHVKSEPWFDLYPFQVSCYPLKQEVLTCAFRISYFLEQYRDWSRTWNRYQSSSIYTMQLDKNLQYIPNSGHLVGIPTPIHISPFNGPEDPRLFSLNGSLFLNYITIHYYGGQVNMYSSRQFLWSLTNSTTLDIDFDGCFEFSEAEKNWAPWVINDKELFFVYQFAPLMRVLHCNVDSGEQASAAKCKFIEDDEDKIKKPIDFIIRGGAPLVHYSGDYYITVTHSVQNVVKDGHRSFIYASQIALISAKKLRVVFISSPILIDPELMLEVPLTVDLINYPFIYARSVFVETDDSLVFSAGLNDNACYLIRLQGFAGLLRQAIKADIELERTACRMDAAMTLLSVSNMRDWIINKNMDVLHGQFQGRNAPVVQVKQYDSNSSPNQKHQNYP